MRRLPSQLFLLTTLATLPLLPACSDHGGEGGASPGSSQNSAEGAPDSESHAALARAEFDVAGMDCGGCVIGTRAALRKVDGVAQADAAYVEETGKGTAWAIYDPARVTPEQLLAAIRELGYAPTLVDG